MAILRRLSKPPRTTGITAAARVAVLTSHPVQYFAPLFRRLAKEREIDLTVLYCSTLGTRNSERLMENFGRHVVWDVDMLDGYRHKFLRSPLQGDPQRRWSLLNPAISTELASGRHDLLVSFGWAYPTNWLAFTVATTRRIPFLLYGDTDIRRPAGTRLQTLRTRTLTKLCGQAAGAFYVGTFNRDFYIRQGILPERLWFAPLAVETERFGAVEQGAARARLGLDPGVCYFLFVGSLIERKCPQALLSAVAELQSDGQRVGAIIVGDGPLAPALRRTVEQQSVRDVRLLGFVNQSDLPDVYAAADALVMPSERDPHPLVLNEAMSAGLPVAISTGTGVWGPGDLVRDGREGLVYPTNNGAALRQACRLLTVPELRAELGGAAKRRVRKWSYDVAVAGWLDAVSSVLGRPAWGRRWPRDDAGGDLSIAERPRQLS